jgi:hypothetical protein
MAGTRKLMLGLALCGFAAACSTSATTAPTAGAPTGGPVATTPATATEAPATQPGLPTGAFAVFQPKAGATPSVTGGATLVGASGQTQVVIAVVVSGANAGTMAASIQAGTCDNLTPEIAYRLTDVTAGASTTSVPVDLSTLLATPYAINISVAGSETESSITCGEIKAGIAP